MSSMKVGAAMRLFMFVVAVVMALGIWLTGYKSVHWLLYVPAAFFLFASLTGICPGMMFSRLITGKNS